MQSGAWPGMTWSEVPDRNKIRSPRSIANLFGDPFDNARFQMKNPASIVDRNPSRLADWAIYLKVGDEDGFGFVEGVDFMHRLLWRHRIRHEFGLVRWADHVGRTIMERSHDRFRSLARYLEQQAPPEPAGEALRARGMEPFGYWPLSTLRSYDSGPADQRRAVRDSEELRKERSVIRIPDIPYDESPGVEPSRQSLGVFTREGLPNAPVVLFVHRH